MSWGHETWLGSTQRDGPATIRGASGLTLAEYVKERPEILGAWARLLFGNDVPIFTKLLRTRFPPFVHMGFSSAIDRDELATMLRREQELLRRLYAALTIEDESAFARFERVYTAWAIEQALRGWTQNARPELEAFVHALEPFLRAGARANAAELLTDLRENRARFVARLNVANLLEELDNMLLSEAGVAHAIFGLSHQTHPIDQSRAALSKLIASLRERASHGDTDRDLESAAACVDLASLRALNAAAPKSEAWMPIRSGGRLVLVEPQQTSNTTLSFADFYTPFTYKERFSFRKGDPLLGVSDDAIDAYVASLDLGASSFDRIRRRPIEIAAGARASRAKLYRLVDEPETFPFFTAYRVDLRGAPAHFEAVLPRGAFQQIVVLSGNVTLEHEGATFELAATGSAFLPATMSRRYALSSRRSARILLTSVPVPHGNDPSG